MPGCTLFVDVVETQFALAAARGLSRHTEMPPREIAETAMGIAAEICVFTNAALAVEEL